MFNRFFKRPDQQQLFWRWFSKNADSYFHFENNQNALFSKLKAELEKINSNLTFEFSPILPQGDRELVISADGVKSAFPAVQDLVKQAPQLKGWKIIAFRQPHPQITQISFDGLTINLDDVFFNYEKNDGRLGLDLYLRNFSESAAWTNAVFILLDNILGEYDAEMLLSYIRKNTLRDDLKDSQLNIYELSSVVQSYKKELYN